MVNRPQVVLVRMEHLWSRAVATSGNRVQMGRPRKLLKQAETVATGCEQLPIGAHDKEGVESVLFDSAGRGTHATATRPACTLQTLYVQRRPCLFARLSYVRCVGRLCRTQFGVTFLGHIGDPRSHYRNKNPRFTGVFEADEGTRTLDLLHGKGWRAFAPVRSRSLKRPVCSPSGRASERQRTRTNVQCSHCCHCDHCYV
jgi:hypothetical protein